MADVDYDFDADDPFVEPAAMERGEPVGPGVLRRYVNLAGALTSVALVIGAGVWGYKLAIRDVQGVPVIQALEGPMRVAPADPGGEIIDYQGLAVNDVAAEGVATPMPERLVLAPRPADLAEEDQPGLAGLASDPSAISTPAVAVTGGESPVLAAAPPAESASPTEVAIDAALAEALGEIPGDLPDDPSLDAPDVDLAMEDLPEGAITLSPRPKSRPAKAGATGEAVSAPKTTAVVVDPATIAVGTRLVQFGAFDTEDEARAAWAVLEGQYPELMSGKGLVLQLAERSGHTFYRLRAHGFDDEDDARRFCSAIAAQGAICIPVAQK